MNRILLIAALAAVGAAANATWYTNEASFNAAIAALNYTEDFSSFTYGSPLDGSQTSWAAPGANGFGWTASEAGGLYSGFSAISTNLSNTTLLLTNTGASISAVGARLSDSDINGLIIAGTVTMSINGGVDTNQVVNTTAVESFLGYIGVNVTTIGFTASNVNVTNNWVNVDHVIVGNPVPEPASMVALGVGALALIRRRRNK